MLPNSIFLIPIREPIQHSYSLFKQHLHFSELQKKDDFVRKYMNYLCHNEFGLNHKSWNDPVKFKDFNNINYWLEQWNFFYKNILHKYQNYNNCFFLIYEKLSNQNYMEGLLNKIQIKKLNNTNHNYFINSNKNKINIDFDTNCLNRSKDIYQNFLEITK